MITFFFLGSYSFAGVQIASEVLSSCSSENSKALSDSIVFLTYNVNYSRRAVDEYAEYGWENRSSDVYKVITNANPTVIFLQEVLSSNMEEVKTNLSQWDWYFEPTNSRNGVCCNAIGIKPSFMDGIKRKKFSYNFSELEKTAEKVMGLVIDDICLVNVHCPMTQEGRFAMANHFDECIPKDREYRLIIAGDFNSFPDCYGPEQLEIVSVVTGTVRVSDEALSEVTGEIAIRSFKPYPYDVVPEEALKMAGKLDHIFINGFQAMNPVVIDSPTVQGKNFSPSDHYPLRVSLE